MEIARGEIYEYNMLNGEKSHVLIIQNDDRKNDALISCIMLQDTANSTGAYVELICGVKMWANCNKVSYGFQNRLGSFVRAATEREMQEVDAGVLKALGIEAGNAPTEIDDECERLKERLYNAEKRVRELTNEKHQLTEGNGLRQLKDADISLLIEKNVLERERDLYKSLFETLQKKMFER